MSRSLTLVCTAGLICIFIKYFLDQHYLGYNIEIYVVSRNVEFDLNDAKNWYYSFASIRTQVEKK